MATVNSTNIINTEGVKFSIFICMCCFLSFRTLVCLNCGFFIVQYIMKCSFQSIFSSIKSIGQMSRQFRFIRLGELSTHYTREVVSSCCRLYYSLSLGNQVVYITLNPQFKFQPFTELSLSSMICFLFVLAICHPEVWSQLAR